MADSILYRPADEMDRRFDFQVKALRDFGRRSQIWLKRMMIGQKLCANTWLLFLWITWVEHSKSKVESSSISLAPAALESLTRYGVVILINWVLTISVLQIHSERSPKQIYRHRPCSMSLGQISDRESWMSTSSHLTARTQWSSSVFRLQANRCHQRS